MADVACPTCGLVAEEPDEPIEPGDYHLIDTTSPSRCPSCGLVPSRGSDAAVRVAEARGSVLCPERSDGGDGGHGDGCGPDPDPRDM